VSDEEMMIDFAQMTHEVLAALGVASEDGDDG
jgi:hypothetical protein